MPRSAADATRFTATGPHAYNNAGAAQGTSTRWPVAAPRQTQSSQSSQQSGGEPGQPGQETPRQKVERLRAQARAARYANSFSLTDRIILRGRVWADRAHVLFVYSMLGLSAVGGCVIVYSFFSLVNHNRRQKALWIDRELQKLYDARKAYVAGTATEEQLETLRKEKAGDEEVKRREELKKQTMWYKTKQFVFGGMKNEDPAEDTPAFEFIDPANAKPSVLEAVNAKKAEGSNVFHSQASDPAASGARSVPSESNSGWKNWFVWR